MNAEPLVLVEGRDQAVRRGRGRRPSTASSFRVEPGQVTGLVGPDGAGKTTLLRLLAGLLLPDGGTDHGLRLRHRAASSPGSGGSVSYMPQRFGLYEDLTVSENLNLYADLRGVTARSDGGRSSGCWRSPTWRRFTDRLAGKLSGGMKQKLGLACALIRTPQAPAARRAERGRRSDLASRALEDGLRLVDQGIGVVWSTAYLDEAERCGRCSC